MISHPQQDPNRLVIANFGCSMIRKTFVYCNHRAGQPERLPARTNSQSNFKRSRNLKVALWFSNAPEALSFPPEFRFGQQELKHRLFRSLRKFQCRRTSNRNCTRRLLRCRNVRSQVEQTHEHWGIVPYELALKKVVCSRQRWRLKLAQSNASFGNKRRLPLVPPRVRLPLP